MIIACKQTFSFGFRMSDHDSIQAVGDTVEREPSYKPFIVEFPKPPLKMTTRRAQCEITSKSIDMCTF